MSTENFHELPESLPMPIDDGACDHLPGMRLPPVVLPSTAGEHVDLSELSGRSVVYCYPRTGRPGEDLSRWWDEISGARRCTPQTCALRDHHVELRAFGAMVFGLSGQSMEYQREAADRLHLSFELLSDKELTFAKALELPTFEVEGMTLIKRLTLMVDGGHIEKVFYPVFPPNENAEEVIGWLRREKL